MTPAHAQTGSDTENQPPGVDAECCNKTSSARDAVHCGHHRPMLCHAVEGDLTIYSASEQKARLLTVFRTPYSIVELDLAQVTQIDTAGVQLLILGCRITVMVGGALRLTNIGPSVASMIQLLKLEDILAQAQNHCPACAADRMSNHV